MLAVVYLIFNEGYLASSGDALTRQELSSEAIRLGRVLADLMPEVLLRLHPRPVARLNHSVAVAMADGPHAGMRWLELWPRTENAAERAFLRRRLAPRLQ